MFAALTEDDVQVLEYMNPQRGQLTGSVAKQPAIEDYPPDSMYKYTYTYHTVHTLYSLKFSYNFAFDVPML